jgi:hypothetical protein
MDHSMLAFAISAAVVLSTQTSYDPQQEGGQRKVVPVQRTAPPSAQLSTPAVKAKSAPPQELSPVQQTLQRDPLLAAMVRGRMPIGTNLLMVAAGFDDVPQFVAAVNASKNLGIPFHLLKRRMVNDGMSLRLAIQDMLPRGDYRSATLRAENEASAILDRP